MTYLCLQLIPAGMNRRLKEVEAAEWNQRFTDQVILPDAVSVQHLTTRKEHIILMDNNK